MGHVLSPYDMKIAHEKAKAVQDLPKPEDVEDIQKIKGFVNYLAKFLPGLADVMEPLRRLTRRDAQWQWTEKQENSFKEVKKLATATPILSYYACHTVRCKSEGSWSCPAAKRKTFCICQSFPD